jgi:hypothetical protein
MQLPPAVAGVTLLSFAGGAPDLFTQLAAVSTGMPALLYWQLMTCLVFVTFLKSVSIAHAVLTVQRLFNELLCHYPTCLSPQLPIFLGQADQLTSEVLSTCFLLQCHMRMGYAGHGLASNQRLHGTIVAL